MNLFPTSLRMLAAVALICTATSLPAAEPVGVGPRDWPQWGGSSARNNTPQAEGIPAEWNVGEFDWQTDAWDKTEVKNVKWMARLGSETYGTPVVAGGKVFVATNNGSGYLKRYPKDIDLGCVLCFRESDGKFLWQFSAEKLTTGNRHDYALQGICCSPLVEGDRMWFVSNRGEVVCLDTEGFLDGENDGPDRSETHTARDEADVIWRLDMMGKLGVRQHNMAACSVTAAGDLLFTGTSNGVEEDDHDVIPAPDAPSFLCLDKRTGEVLWSDNSPGRNILHGQWSSPAYGVLGGVPQVLFAGGDGWLYSFLATREGAGDGKAKLLWKFDCNPKTSKYYHGSRGERNSIISTPVTHDGRVYLGVGRDPEYGDGVGHLWCIDPTKRGDVSPELAFDKDGNPLPPRRFQAVDPEAGETARPNPNSAVIWHYSQHDANGDGKFDFEETFHRTMGNATIEDGLLYVADISGLFHCLDAATGKPHWTFDQFSTCWGTPVVADGKVTIADSDGEMTVFKLSAEQEILAQEINMGDLIHTSAVIANNVLYIATRSRLFAVAAE